MATLNLGRIKPVFQGAYNNSTAYVVDDIVTFGDETFICIQASTGNATSNASYWTKMAAKGTDGTDLGTTITTQGDILYRDGSGLARLAAGTSGYFLKTQGSGANPVWAESSGGVVQTKYYTTGNSFTYSSNSYGNLGSLSITLTPTSTSNKLLLFFQTGSAQGDDSGNNTTEIRFYNDTASSAVGVGNSNGSRSQGGSRVTGASYSSPNHADNHSMFAIIDISNTNATTFKVQCRNESGTSYWGRAKNYANDSGTYNATFRTTFMIQEIKQ